MKAERWRHCLARPGARLLKTRRGGYAIHPGNDRRRRPLARLSAAEAALAIAAGELIETGEELGLPEPAGAQASQPKSTPPQRLERANMLDDHGELTPVTINRLSHPLGRYRDQLSPVHMGAADHFLRDHAASTLNARITRNWSLDSGGARSRRGPEDAPVAALAAKERVLKALDAVGASLAPVITAALVSEESLSALERRFGWAPRSGMTVLKLALDALARHYRLG